MESDRFVDDKDGNEREEASGDGTPAERGAGERASRSADLAERVMFGGELRSFGGELRTSVDERGSKPNQGA